MNPLFIFILLAALWGGSFSFMRIITPVLGTYGASFFRAFLAAIGLLLILIFLKKLKPKPGISFYHYAVVGLLNSALPFMLFNYASHQLPSNVSAILNSSTPFFGFILGLVWLKESFRWRSLLGILLGISGIVVVRGIGSLDQLPVLPILACLLATSFYAGASVYSRIYLPSAESIQIATFSLICAALFLFPIFSFTDLPHIQWNQFFTVPIILSTLALSLLGSAMAYFLYFYLIKIWGPTKTVCVTFVVPLFGVIWGYLLLHEIPTSQIWSGGTLIILGTFLIIKKN
jgi:drug/metabolite transporter (DMT)-like permease